MIARLVLAIVLLAPELAHARHHCQEVSHVVGYSRCARFGAFWGARGSLWLEAGATALRFDPGRPVTAYGGAFGEYFGVGRIYFGAQWTFAAFDGGPAVAAREATATTATSSSGGLGQVVFVVGTHRALGPITLGADLGPGLRIAELTSNDAIAQLVVDARGRAIIWLSPRWSLGAQASADLAHPGSYAFGVFVGAHLVAYDNTR